MVLLGTFARKAVSREEAEHYAKDLGETTASGPERFEYSMVVSPFWVGLFFAPILRFLTFIKSDIQE